MSGRHQEGSAARMAVALMLMLVLGLALGVAGSYYWFRGNPAPQRVDTGLPPPPPIVPSATPELVAPLPSPTPEAASPVPEATPEAAESKPRVPSRVARAGKPQGPAVRPVAPSQQTPPPAPIAPMVAAPPGRRFVQGSTSVESLRPTSTDLRGFDPADVDVKRAPTVIGRLELEMDPDRVVPGHPYVVRVYLANDGQKPIELGGMKAATLVDGKWVQVPLTPENKVVAPRQRALLRELPGTWQPTVGSWAVEVEVTSKRRDVYKNRLTWK